MILEMLQAYPNLREVVAAVSSVWPEHEAFLIKGLSEDSEATLRVSEDVAAKMRRICSGRMDEVVQSYKWLCERINEETLYFIRNGNYRNTSIKEVISEIYSDDQYMNKYMDGLMLSTLLWKNHRESAEFFVNAFLPKLKKGFNILEIGPGHGLYLALAAAEANCATATGWDISEESVRLTQHCLEVLQATDRVSVAACDACENEHEGVFDAIVMSEVLEHVENPLGLLAGVRQKLTPDGRIFVNVPVNSPAPDHIYCLRHPDEAVTLLQDGGFKVLEHRFQPMAGYNLQRAIAKKATISCVLIGSL